MGREAEGQISYLGSAGTGKLLLEGAEVLCQGEVRLRLPRADILDYFADDGDLILTTAQGRLTATLGAKEAALWVKALAKPPPSLADKLGIGPGKAAFAAMPLRDTLLCDATKDHLTADVTLATMAVAEMFSDADLAAALSRIGDLPLWGVTVKGKASPFSDAQLRQAMRSLGYVDTKSCAVSDQMTATRWQRRKE